MDEQTKKWRKVFEVAGRDLSEGIYLPKELNSRDGLILVSQEIKESLEDKVFQMRVDFENHSVVFYTDSVDILKTFSTRRFPLSEFAEAVQDIRIEVIFDGGSIGSDGNFEFGGMRVRVIPLVGPNTFELRAIKR